MDRSSHSKPEPKDLAYHFSRVSQRRRPLDIKEFYKYMLIPGIGNVAGGMPNHNLFPFDTLEGAAALPDRFKPTPNKPVDPSLPARSVKPPRLAAAQVVVPKVSTNQDPAREIDLKNALQYGTAEGIPPLRGFLRQFVRENLHPNVPYEGGPEVILTNGSTDGFAKTIQCFNNEWTEGHDPTEQKEGLLCEEFAYPLALQAAAPRGINIVPVRTDHEGMLAAGSGGLADVLENWDESRGRRPHLMYTVTIGQNPTSGVLSVERRKEIYILCSKYDIIIIEDDPYWALQYPSAARMATKLRGSAAMDLASEPGARNYNSPKSSGYAFLDSLVPSYLSIDVDGRVVRLDTFSKTIAPGCRLGWITAQPAIIEKMQAICESATQQPSGFVQSLVAQLILGTEGVTSPRDDEEVDSAQINSQKAQNGWKTGGWVRWLEGLRGEYERRMNTMCEILDEGRYYVKTGRRPSLEYALASVSIDDGIAEEEDEWRVVNNTMMYDFQWPRAGMFVWLELKLESHPIFRKVGPEKLARGLWVFLTQKPNLVLVGPGNMFCATPEIAKGVGWRYMRLSFTKLEDDEVRAVSLRFAAAIRTFWRMKDPNDIEEMAAQSTGLETQTRIPGFC